MFFTFEAAGLGERLASHRVATAIPRDRPADSEVGRYDSAPSCWKRRYLDFLARSYRASRWIASPAGRCRGGAAEGAAERAGTFSMGPDAGATGWTLLLSRPADSC